MIAEGSHHPLAGRHVSQKRNTSASPRLRVNHTSLRAFAPLRGSSVFMPCGPRDNQACAKTLVPTMPTTVSAMKQAWTPLTLSPNRMTPPMITPIAPAPVQIA